MPLLMNEDDVNKYIDDVIRLIAKKLNIVNYDIETQDNLKNNIKNKDSKIDGKLNDFIKNYREWHNFHVQRDKANKGKDCNFTLEEYESFLKLIENRDNARNELIESVNDEIIKQELIKKVADEDQQDRDLHENAKENKKKHFSGK